MSKLVLSGGIMTVTAETLVSDDFSSSPSHRLTVAKQRHKHLAVMRFASGTDVTALSQCVHIAGGAGTVTAVEITPDVAPSGGDLKWTVDVHRSTSGGSFGTVLSSTKDVSHGSANRTPVVASLDSTKVDYVDNDVLQIIVTVSGSTGSQGQGGIVKVWLDENPA